ncbi:MAG TPA: hypothetical protein VEC19_01075 [Usitatibacter sp.]|nr:hypothetical protein [Usitatibacter sp.]
MLTWFRRIDMSRNPAEALEVVREYVAALPSEELARLPQACRPGRIKDEAEVERLRAALVAEFRDGRQEGEALASLQRLTSLVVRASIRLADLRGQDDDGPRGDDPPPPSGKRAAPARRG